MHAVIQILNAQIPAPPPSTRIRVWMLIGSAYAFFGGVRLDVESHKQGEASQLMLRYTLGNNSRTFPADTAVPMWIGCSTLIARGVAMSPAGNPLAVLMEVQRAAEVSRVGAGFEVVA